MRTRIAVICTPVLALPSGLAEITTPRRAACQRSNVTATSRTPTTSAIHSGRRPMMTSEASAAPTRSLSANGSASRPKSVIMLRVRATWPSAASVRAARPNTAAASGNGPTWSPNSNTSISGTITMRLSVSRLAVFSGTMIRYPAASGTTLRVRRRPSGALHLESARRAPTLDPPAREQRPEIDGEEPDDEAREVVDQVMPAEVERRHPRQGEVDPHADAQRLRGAQQLGDQRAGEHDPDVQGREGGDALQRPAPRGTGQERVPRLQQSLLQRARRRVRELGEEVRLGEGGPHRGDQEVAGGAQDPGDREHAHPPEGARPVGGPHERGADRQRHERQEEQVHDR